MPVFWFALSLTTHINWWSAALIFFILHLLIYPSSNGYNSYMDRDETSIGLIKNPKQPTRQLYRVTVVMDIFAVALAAFVSALFFAGVVFYIICSRLYSYRGVRLKQFPIAGYFTVIINQGAVIFFIVWSGAQPGHPMEVPWQGLVAAAFLIGGFYPITQVYQHQADAGDGVTTISMLLGKRGTFVFCAAMYLVAFSLLYIYFFNNNRLFDFVILNIFYLPVIFYFIKWMLQVWKQPGEASFKKTMNMNWLASTCTSLAFITLILLQHRG